MMKLTKDRAPTHDRMGFLTAVQLGPKQSLTPEGFLLCEAVPIARTGSQVYSADEIGLEGRAGDGLVNVLREEHEVFRDETLASFEGKPVTIDHPEEGVSPENWKQLAIGVVQNVRRGTGVESDLMLADLLITDHEGIEAVRTGLREVSCGYEADYEQIDPGNGRQMNIIGNHVALVERGRAGPRCSIQDKENEIMSKQNAKKGLLTKLRGFFDSLGEEEKKILDEADPELEGKEKTDDEADPYEERFAKIEDSIGQMTEGMKAMTDAIAALGKTTEDEDDPDNPDAENMNTGDEGDLTDPETAETNKEAIGTAFTGDSLKDIIARAEILSPGIQVPTGDAAKGPKAAMALARKALANAYATEDGKALITPLLAGRQIGKLTSDALHSTFFAASELMRAHNNAKGIRPGVVSKDFGRRVTPADINARNREHWAKTH